MSDRIVRSWDLDATRIYRGEDGGDMPTFHGHAAVFNQATLIGTRQFGFTEEIAPRAFDDVLEDDVRLLINHGGLPLARTTNGTLRLSQDREGLVNEADFAPTTEARDLSVLIERGDVNQQSFAFTIAEEMWSTRELDGVEMDHRTITKIKRLYDTSIVTYPAYEGAIGGFRTYGASDEEITRALREVHGEAEAQARLTEQIAIVESRLRELSLRKFR